jgi:hypothetical protein
MAVVVVDVFAVDLLAVLVVVVKLFFEKVKVLVVEVLVEVAEIFKINLIFVLRCNTYHLSFQTK